MTQLGVDDFDQVERNASRAKRPCHFPSAALSRVEVSGIAPMARWMALSDVRAHGTGLGG